MIIGVDGGALSIEDKRLKVGVYQFTYNFLINLSKTDKENIYEIYTFRPLKKELSRQLGINFKNVVLKPTTGWMKGRLSLYFLTHKIDLFLAINQAIPQYHPFKIIGFIHGLDFTPKFHTNLTKLRNNTDFLIKNSDFIITTSVFLRKSILSKYKVKNVKVLNPAAADYFSPKGLKHKNKKPYILFVGSIKPNKNLKNIVKGFNLFNKNSNNSFNLLIIGGDFWYPNLIGKLVSEADRKHIKFLGFIQNSKLPKYYRGAVGLISPSLYEGFGIPLLEAMTCGCPVIAGNRSAEKEVVGKGGTLVNPKNIKEIARSINEIEKNNERYRRYALEESRKFSWKKYAEKFHQLIKEYEA